MNNLYLPQKRPFQKNPAAHQLATEGAAVAWSKGALWIRPPEQYAHYGGQGIAMRAKKCGKNGKKTSVVEPP